MSIRSSLMAASLLCLHLLAAYQATAQSGTPETEDSVLKQVIIFGRHGVRSAALPSATISVFASRPYPDFGVPTGYLTAHGYRAEMLLGAYYREYLLKQGLLTGNDPEDAKHAYFRANSIQRSNISAAALAAAMLPKASVAVHSYPLGQADPVFDPVGAKVVTVDAARAVAESAGVYGTNGAALVSAYGAEFALIRSVLFGYPIAAQPPPVPDGLVDPTALPVPLTASTTNIATGNLINAGGIASTLYAADPFVMEYTEGLPLSQVAWGQLTPDTLSQQTRIITLDFAIQLGTPYLNRLQSSNAAAHILRSMEQAVTGRKVPGAFSEPDARLLVLNSSDGYVAGVANLLHLHWLLPGYQPDYCPPGGALVFELRQSKRSGEFLVRVNYTAQTFDQLRNLTPLSRKEPPATMRLLIPGGGHSADDLELRFSEFAGLLESAIDPHDVQDPDEESPPGPLTGVPLK
jgi:4-phytase/acid phosphatase